MVNERDLVAQWQHLATDGISVFDVSDRHCLIRPNELILGAPSGTDNVEGRPRQFSTELFEDFAG
jgi:hypothetical protein